MHELMLENRKNIVFLNNPEKFSSNCENFINKLDQLISEKKENKDKVLEIVKEICIDLQSFLVNWVLQKYIDQGKLSQKDIEKEINKMYSFIKKHNGDEVINSIEKEVGQIANSNTKRICDKELAGELYTYWGHDYCSGLSHSLRRGACFLTSNPAKINEFRKDFPDVFQGFIEEIRSQYPGISKENLISFLFLKVVAISARELYPIYEASDRKNGFACIQVNPKNWKDSDKMSKEIEFWNEEFKKELNTDNPNIVYKIPAVSEAPKTVEKIISQGLRVCMTLNFTYSQHEIFAELIEKGENNGFVVLMSGFLDDSVEKELASLGIEDPKKYSRHAGEAVIRKSYANLKARGYKKTSIMSAAIRGEYTIKNSLTSYKEYPMYFTTKTERILDFDSEPRELLPLVDEPVSEEIMSVLKKSNIFNQAYERKLLTLANVDEYIPLKWVHSVFINAYNELEENLT